MKIQRESLILGNNMSSGVTVPIFGKKITKMRQWEQLEVQDNSSENKASVWTNFKNFFACLTGMKKLIFYLNKFFCSGHFFDPSNLKKWPKNDPSKKICKSKKSVVSCLSTMQRNFWNSFILSHYFQSCFPKLPIAHAVSFLRIFCRKLAQWHLRTSYFLKWVTPSEFPFVGFR